MQFCRHAGRTDGVVRAAGMVVACILTMFSAWRVMGGGATRQVWLGVPGSSLGALEADPRFPAAPDRVETLNKLQSPPDWGDRYGERIAGYLVPPRTGEYTFWIAGDDACALRISTDDAPARVREVARVRGYTAPHAWDASPEQKSPALHLEAGRPYYFEVLHKEGGGADHVAVAWRGPGIERSVIDGRYLRPLTGKERFAVVARPDHVAVLHDESIICAVLTNDRSPLRGGTLRVVRFSKRSARGGTVTQDGPGRLLYRPPHGFVGRDSFTYTVSDGRSEPASATVYVGVNAPPAPDAVRSVLLNGVQRLEFPQRHGAVAVFGPTALGVVRAPDGKTLAAAAAWGRGRLVVFGEKTHAELDRFGDRADNTCLYRNVLQWCGGGKPLADLRIATSTARAAEWLRAHGCRQASRIARIRDLPPDVDVFVTTLGPFLPEEDALRLAEVVAERGRGLFASASGYQWAWSEWLPAAPTNRLLREAGLGWAAGTVKKMETLTQPNLRGSRFSNVRNVIEALRSGGLKDRPARAEAGCAAAAVLSVLPEEEGLAQELGAALLRLSERLCPSPKSPVSDPLDRVALEWEAGIVARTPVDQVKPHRTAPIVYGEIPPGAPRVTRSVHIDARRPARGAYGQPFGDPWYSTELYAAPGEMIELRFPGHVVGHGVLVRINSDINDLRNYRTTYLRMPYGVSRTFSVNAPVVRAANAYGGLIFVQLPREYAPGEFDVVVRNAVEAPSFVLGRDTNRDWVSRIRRLPAPRCEIVTPELIITTWSRELRNIEDMEALAKFWLNGIRAQDELACTVGLRTRPERIINVPETFVGSGYASYPIGAWQWRFGNYEDLIHGACWGQYHELGHLHQRPWWTFSGTGEVTVNIFTMVAIDKACRSHSRTGGWGRMWDPGARAAMCRRMMKAGGFDKVGLAERLVMYAQLRTAFGWDAFRRTFKSYLDADPGSLPKGDHEKRDQWMVRFSRAVKRDLSPFFLAWNLGVSDRAVASLRGLRKWNMVEPVVDVLFSEDGSPVDFTADDLTANDFAFDGVIRFRSVGSASHGRLKEAGPNRWRFEPDGSGANGEFSYVVANRYGDAFSGSVRVRRRHRGGLLHHWPLDETGGQTARDVLRPPAHGTYVGGPRLGAPPARPGLGHAVEFDGKDDAVALPALHLESDRVTITAWVRRNGKQSGWNAIFFSRAAGTVAGIGLGTHNELRYHWNGANWNWDSGLVVPDGEWTFVALVIDPDKATLWLNERRAVHAATHHPEAFAGPACIGAEQPGRRPFRGAVDDVRVYLKALTSAEIAGVREAGGRSR